MIKDFVMIYMLKKDQLQKKWDEEGPKDYEDIVTEVIKLINPDRNDGLPDYDRVHCIDEGDYQGTLLFVIAAAGYQPDDFWTVKVYYGSCSGCDTFEACEGVHDYMTLALHIVQGLKEVG